MEIRELLELVVAKNASDLHLAVGVPPVLRVHGKLEFLHGCDKLTPQESERIIFSMLNEEQRERFAAKRELDFSFGIPNLSRFRINVHRQRGSVASSIRRLATEIKSLGQLGLPNIVADLASLPKGLVLVTGATGSGKSTTLAAMIDVINDTKAMHIITIEDPIEYLYPHKKSVIEQREVSSDTDSFAIALKYVLRQDPDVILVGEMRDLETMAAAVTSAETGHLVLATLHTSDAVQTIDRIIDVFPYQQQQQIRIQISLALQGVVSQQLIPRADGKGQVPAVEIMIATPAVRNLIRESKTHQIYSIIETSAKLNMQSMDQALYSLCIEGRITPEEALTKGRDSEALRRKLRM